MSEFTPRFPRSVSGGDYRFPLYHPDIEAIGRRLDRLYRDASLTEGERALVLRSYTELMDIDPRLAVDFLFSASPLHETSIRPPFWRTAPILFGHQYTERDVFAGFVWRIRDIAGDLECRHFANGRAAGHGR